MTTESYWQLFLLLAWLALFAALWWWRRRK